MTTALDKAIRAGQFAAKAQLNAHRNDSFEACVAVGIQAALHTLAEPDEAGIEAAARELFGPLNEVWDRRWAALHENGLAFTKWSGDEIPHEGKNFFRAQARAAITAYYRKVLGETS